MKNKFEIIVSSPSREDRPPISYKVREYFEAFIVDNVLKKKGIIVNGNWEIHIVLDFLPETQRYQSDYIYMPDKPTSVVSEEKVKTYTLLIPMKLLKGASQPYLKTIKLIYEALTIFLTRAYKKIALSEMAEVWKSVDLDYLLSLPYPAPLTDQKYLTDIQTSDGRIVDFWDTVITTEHRVKK